MRSLQAVDMSQGTYNWNVYWVVFEKPAPLGSNRPVNMASLHILLGGSAEDRTGVARQMSPGQGPDTVIPAAGVKASMKELIDQLSDKYVFVCEYDVRTMHL
jgi:hypothetical protein